MHAKTSGQKRGEKLTHKEGACKERRAPDLHAYRDVNAKQNGSKTREV